MIDSKPVVNNKVYSGYTTNLTPLARSCIRSIPVRSFAALIHRLVCFQLTSPLAYIIAQLYRAPPFFTPHKKSHSQTEHKCKKSVYKQFHFSINIELIKILHWKLHWKIHCSVVFCVQYTGVSFFV